MPLNTILTRAASIGLATLLGSSLLGCVSQDDYRAMKLQRDDLAAELAETQRQAEAQRALAAGYRGQIDRVDNAVANEGAMQANYEMQIASLTGERDDLASRYEELVGKIGTGPALPAALTSELSSYAAENPDLIEFDADRGIVKFKSDVTFKSGDAELVADAKQAIDRFATILNSPVARSYQLRIEGHTDNVKGFSANTIAKGHKDNWYLSSHRAISVAQGLMGQGIDAGRIGVLGYADQQPAASNASAAGRAQNRRVEVLILPQTVAKGGQASPEPDAMPAAAVENDMETDRMDDSDSMK